MSPEESWIFKEKHNGKKTDGFLVDVERLHNGEPLAYIIGHIPFLNSNIYLDSHPLIPRTETEFWVEKVIEQIQKSNIHPPKILDLCAGSGCIGVAIGKAVSEAEIHFAEIDSAHHATILKNIIHNDLDTTQTKIFGGDLFERAHPQYDCIVSNPPYISTVTNQAEKSVTEYEPHLALFGGNDGLDVIRRIVTHARAQLTDSGVLYIEHEPEQAEAIHLIGEQNLFVTTAHTDQYNCTRYSRLAMAQ